MTLESCRPGRVSHGVSAARRYDHALCLRTPKHQKVPDLLLRIMPDLLSSAIAGIRSSLIRSSATWTPSPLVLGALHEPYQQLDISLLLSCYDERWCFTYSEPPGCSDHITTQSPDLIDTIDALERQLELRPFTDDAQSGEGAPPFGDIQNEEGPDASRSAKHQTYENSGNAPGYAASIVSQPSFLLVSTEYELPRLEYS